MVTVKVGPKPVVDASIIAITATTTYTDLLNITISGQSSEERARLAALPVTVSTFTGPQHLSSQRAGAQLSALVSASIALGYRHVLFAYAPPSQQPAPRPSASAFEHMMGLGLPDRETGADEDELSFDKALYNWLVDSCEADRLGVRRDEKEDCAKLLKAVRDSLQTIDGRESSFQYARVPQSFKSYKTGVGAVKRTKKPAKKELASGLIRGYADRLRGAIDRNAFTHSPLWAGFVADCDELYNVLMLKYHKMRGDAEAEAERRANPTVCIRPPPARLSPAHLCCPQLTFVSRRSPRPSPHPPSPSWKGA